MRGTDRGESIPIDHHITRAPRHTGWLTLILIAGGFAVVLAGLRSPLFDLDRHAVPKELALHVSALLVLPWAFADRRRIETGLVGTLLFAWAVWSSLSAILATNGWLALRALGITVSALILFAAARRAATAGHATAVLAGLCAAAVLAAALAAAQAYGVDWAWLAGSRPPGGTFGNRNFVAHLLAIVLPSLVVLSLHVGRAAFPVGLAGLAVLACTIVLTRSRAGWLAAAVALAVTAAALWLRARHTHAAAAPWMGSGAARLRPTRGLLVVLALGAGAACAVLLPNRLEWRSDAPYSETLMGIANYRGGSGQGRLTQYRNTLALVREAPVLGVGPGNWFVHYPRVTAPGDPAFAAGDPIPTNPWPSSDWVAFLAERGVVGALLLFLAGAAAVFTSLRRLRPGVYLGAGAGAGPVTAALPGTFAAAGVAGLFDAVLLLAAPTYFVFCLAGALLPATRAALHVALPRRLGHVLFAGMLILLAILALTTAGRLAAIRITGAGRTEAALERALRFDPGNHRLHLLLARRGACSTRVPHARAAAGLMPFHSAPVEALRACGQRPD